MRAHFFYFTLFLTGTFYGNMLCMSHAAKRALAHCSDQVAPGTPIYWQMSVRNGGGLPNTPGSTPNVSPSRQRPVGRHRATRSQYSSPLALTSLDVPPRRQESSSSRPPVGNSARRRRASSLDLPSGLPPRHPTHTQSAPTSPVSTPQAVSSDSFFSEEPVFTPVHRQRPPSPQEIVEQLQSQVAASEARSAAREERERQAIATRQQKIKRLKARLKVGRKKAAGWQKDQEAKKKKKAVLLEWANRAQSKKYKKQAKEWYQKVFMPHKGMACIQYHSQDDVDRVNEENRDATNIADPQPPPTKIVVGPVWIARKKRRGLDVDLQHEQSYMACLADGQMVNVEYLVDKDVYYAPDAVKEADEKALDTEILGLYKQREDYTCVPLRPKPIDPAYIFGGGILASVGVAGLVYAVTQYIKAGKAHQQVRQVLTRMQKQLGDTNIDWEKVGQHSMEQMVRSVYADSQDIKKQRNRAFLRAVLATALGGASVAGGIALARKTQPQGSNKPHVWLDRHADCPGYR